MIYLRATYHIPVNDDVSYQFVLGEHAISSPDNDYTDRVDNFGDLVKSQTNHWLYSNGRTIVHTLVQLYAGIVGYGAYNVFIAILMVLTIWLFVRYSCVKKYWTNPIIYLSASICFLYLYPSPEGMFFWVVYGLNYLFPLCLVLVYLLIFRSIHDKTELSILKTVLLFVFGFVVGWTHEGFAIPLSCAVFFFVVTKLKQLHYPIFVLSVALWIGTAFLTFSPANFSRLGSSMIVNVLNGLDIYIRLRLFWLSMVVIFIAMIMDKQRCKVVFSKYRIVVVACVVGMLFGFVANTGAWSLTGTEFFASLIMFALLPVIFDRFSITAKVKNLVAILVLLLISIHQVMIIEAAIKIYRQEKAFICEYHNSPHGYVKEPVINLSPLVKPFIINWFDSYTYKYIMFSVAVSNGTKDKLPIVLGDRDWDAIYAPEKFFVDENKMSGNSLFYEGDRYYWIKKSDFNPSGEYFLDFSPVKPAECPYLLLKFKAIFDATSFPSKAPVDKSKIMCVPGQDGQILMLEKDSWRSVSQINLI